MFWRFAAIMLMLVCILPRAAHAHDMQQPRCKGNAQVVGSCFMVHGRLSAWNGSPGLRIVRIGTRRILGVNEVCTDPAQGECPNIPDELASIANTDHVLYGDFFVCPFTKSQLGVMEDICIESVSHLVVTEFDAGTQKYRYVSGPTK